MFLDVTQIALRKSRLCIVRHTGNGTTPVPSTDLIMRHSCLSSVIAANQGLPKSFRLRFGFQPYFPEVLHPHSNFVTVIQANLVIKGRQSKLRKLLVYCAELLVAPCFISENVGLKTFCARPVVIDRNIIIANPKSKINRVLISLKNSTCAVCYQQKADHYLQCPQVGLYVPRYDHVDALDESYVDVSTNQVSVYTISIQCCQTS